MLPYLRHKVLLKLQLRESWGLFLVLGVILLSFPFLNIFNSPHCLLGLPLIYLYLMAGWLFSIGVMYLFAAIAGGPSSSPPLKVANRE